MISENRAELKQAITALREGMERFGKASTEIEQLVKENRQQVGSAITNFSEMSERIGRLVEENREAIRQAIVHFDELAGQFTKLVEENRYSLKSAIDRLPTAVDNVANAAKSIETAVEENRENLKTTVANITAFTPKLNRIGDNLEVITTQIASGKGTVGKLVFEDTLHDKVVAAVDNFNQRLEEVKPVTSGFSDLKLYLGADGGINTHTGAGYYGAYLRIEPRPWKFYQGGITYRTSPTDRIPLQEDPNKLNVDFNLLVGWRFFPDDEAQLYRLSVAAGLIDSNVGGTVQVPLLRRLTLDAMGRRKDYQRDPQDRRYEDGKVLVRAALTFRLWDRIYLSAGGDDLAEHAAPWVGLRAELLDNDLRNLTSVMGLAK
jgi:methyl-accepting chemotaxis protein